MKRLPPLAVLAVLVFALAWFVPVHKNGTNTKVPGWEAFTLALEIPARDNPYLSKDGIVMRTSACTNFLMLLTIFLLLARPGQKPTAWLPVAFDVATIVNAWWLTGGNIGDLRIGYFLWLASFALMAIALYLMRKPGKA